MYVCMNRLIISNESYYLLLFFLFAFLAFFSLFLGHVDSLQRCETDESRWLYELRYCFMTVCTISQNSTRRTNTRASAGLIRKFSQSVKQKKRTTPAPAASKVATANTVVLEAMVNESECSRANERSEKWQLCRFVGRKGERIRWLLANKQCCLLVCFFLWRPLSAIGKKEARKATWQKTYEFINNIIS